jgi:hypothetical protein
MKQHQSIGTSAASLAVALFAAACGGQKAGDYPPSYAMSQSSSTTAPATPTVETMQPAARTETVPDSSLSTTPSTGPTAIVPATPNPPASDTTTTANPSAISQPADRGSQPDNTRVNTRDRGGESLTPMDQGRSKSDREITQNIRKAVVADKSLSFSAKNVKIITVNGKVTLRGPVKTESEKANIEAAARKVASDVDSQIEVKK